MTIVTVPCTVVCSLQLVDCFGGHLPVERRLALALELRSLCGGIAKEKVCIYMYQCRNAQADE